MQFRQIFARFCASLCFFVLAVVGAHAHPHVFVEARAQLVFNDAGELRAIRHRWVFDDMYTAYALQGLDRDGDGQLTSPDELAALKRLASDSLIGMEEYGYFTFGDNTVVEMDFVAPETAEARASKVPLQKYWVLPEADRLELLQQMAQGIDTGFKPNLQLFELSFELPLKEPVTAQYPLTVDVYDPTYYVDFKWAKGVDVVTLDNAPEGCEIEILRPQPMDAVLAEQLAALGPDVTQLPENLQGAAASQINQVIVKCGDAEAATPYKSGEAAVAAMASGGGTSLEKLSKGEGRAEKTKAPAAEALGAKPSVSQGNLYSNAMAQVARLQNEFFNKLRGALRSFKASSHAGFWLMLVSFAYGVFHALGPGHGKAVISSYVLADRQTLRRGVSLALLSSMMQAITAIVLVFGVATLFQMSGAALDATALQLEKAAYALMLVFALWLVWQKVVRPIFVRAPEISAAPAPVAALASPAMSGHSTGVGSFACDAITREQAAGEVCADCGHVHLPQPEALKGDRFGWARAWPIVLSIGARPCTGALIVLAFSISQGLVLAGVASTFVMALGTGITVSALAALAVFSRAAAMQIWGRTSESAERLGKVIEQTGVLLVLLFALVLTLAGFGWY
ncbi:DUF1007 family protein [Polycladidibacter hongkongensis]|uniref:HoxN/HupN/NixA family nickel/cobalt transporter n=1 Tax=Polycladidibacter hongkongensis TaxID=1647556 RepID=UPI00155E3793|nr:DUF1007 family protein [Pseudovibrio hongkongensis]